MILAGSIMLIYGVLEWVLRGYSWPKEPWWVLRGILWFVANATVGYWLVYGMHLLIGPHKLLDLSVLGVWAAVPALAVYELSTYGVHRAMHASPALWRVHQLHHSSERIDVWSTWRAHPLEQVAFTVCLTLVSIGVLGTTGEAAYAVSLVLLVVGHFQHSNLRTPRWLGYIVARPENHMLHHERDAHTTNYSDFPVIDWLFGTLTIPDEAPEAAGFWDGASRRVGPMLLFQDGTERPSETL